MPGPVKLVGLGWVGLLRTHRGHLYVYALFLGLEPDTKHQLRAGGPTLPAERGWSWGSVWGLI